MSGEDISRIVKKLDNIQGDVTKTKESAIRTEEKVHGHGEDIERHEEDIKELFSSRDAHALTLNTIVVEDKTKEKLSAKYATRKQFRITKTMWIIGLLVTALIASAGWIIRLSIIH